MQRSAYQAYNQAMHTVGKTRQVVMLYDGAIRFMQQAKLAIEEKQIEARYKLLLRVSEIIMGLQSSLDFDQGGNIARVLYDYYSSLDVRLTRIQRTNDLALCDEVIEELKQMRGVWFDIDEKQGKDAAEVAAPVTQTVVAADVPLVMDREAILPNDFTA